MVEQERTDGETPWDRGAAPDLTPEKFEKHVVGWLQEWAKLEGLSCEITHQGVLHGEGGDYHIDVLVELTLLGGAQCTILAECKHQRRRVERKEILALEAKLRDVGAHKGMLFTTARFQKGALEYASARGIAALAMRDGRIQYETRSLDAPPDPPPWLHFEPVVGVCMSIPAEGRVVVAIVDRGRVDALSDWFAASNKKLDEFRASADDPLRWHQTAREFVVGANYLLDWHDFPLEEGAPKDFSWTHQGPSPALVLYAVAVEALLKALLVAGGRSLVSDQGLLKGEYGHHNLVHIAQDAGLTLTPDDEDTLLRRLGDVAQAGRYHVGKRPGHTPEAWTFHYPRDPERIWAFLEKAEQQLKAEASGGRKGVLAVHGHAKAIPSAGPHATCLGHFRNRHNPRSAPARAATLRGYALPHLSRPHALHAVPAPA